MALAAVICPAAVEPVRAVRVADGAHTLDRVVLAADRGAASHWTGGSVPVGPPAVRPIDDARSRWREKMRGMGKSM